VTTFNIEDAQGYVAEVRGRYAKTMPDWPHEYTVRSWRPDLAEAFEAFCHLIQKTGIAAPWPPAPAAAIYHNHYLVVGPQKYWAMGPRGDADPVKLKTVINRTLA